MEKQKDDHYYLAKIADDLKLVEERIDGIDYESFLGDLKLQDSIIFRIIQISENAKHILESSKEKIKDAIQYLIGMRNRIVYDYGIVSMHIIYSTVVNDFPELLNEISTLINGK